MQLISQQVKGYIGNSSWIRRMFESGIELKRQFGADNVCDFSLGNPDLPPPPDVQKAMHRLADRLDQPLSLGYMPNAGYPSLRAKLAAFLSEEQHCALQADHVVVTCGAAGALNAFFRAVLEPGEEVICPAPYFVEYRFYVENFGGTLKPVLSNPADFSLDLNALEAALTPKTRAVLIDSPNNPTGVVYPEATLRQLSALLQRHSARHGRPVFLVSDEPYRFLVYDGTTVPPVLPLYKYSVVIGSFSKSLSLAGERIGYLAVNPAMEEAGELVAGVILANRILGFVNAPAVGQQLLEETLGHQVDVNVYQERRDAMARLLSAAGIDFVLPRGAFYFFPRVPGKVEDTEFCRLLTGQRILAVPGRGFGYPGCFRLTFCVDKAIIERAAEGFQRAAQEARAL